MISCGTKQFMNYPTIVGNLFSHALPSYLKKGSDSITLASGRSFFIYIQMIIIGLAVFIKVILSKYLNCYHSSSISYKGINQLYTSVCVCVCTCICVSTQVPVRIHIQESLYLFPYVIIVFNYSYSLCVKTKSCLIFLRIFVTQRKF